MYKNIVFDFGGVMVDFDPYEYLVDLFGNHEVEDEVFALTFGSEEWQLLDAGRITRGEANLRMLDRAKRQAVPLRYRAFLTTGCISSAPAAGCRPLLSSSSSMATASTT